MADIVVKGVLLDVDTVLITEIVEVSADIGEPDCKLINPYQFFAEDDLRPWPSVTDQREMMIHSSRILTIIEPISEVIEKYLELVNS
jgi:hypothetical protein